MDIQSAIRAVTELRDLNRGEMTAVMQSVMTGEATPAQIGGFLIGLRMKGESIEEITAAAAVMRELATAVEVPTDGLVDVVGTGGDGAHTFNISTVSAFVVAGAGGRVAKHGNRSASSTSGAADVLEAAGVNLDLTPEQIARCVEEIGVGFMFAPRHHAAMRHAIGPRREMAVRTVFNLLGPLTNPAGAPNQLIGVYARQWLEPLAQVLLRLGSRHVMIVHADDGLDEISLGAATQVAELHLGEVRSYAIDPEALGFPRVAAEQLRVGSAQESLEVIEAVLDGRPGPPRDIVLLNAGAATYVAGLADSLAGGIERARESIDSGAARTRLERLIELSATLAGASA